MKRTVVFAIIALFLAPVILRSLGYFEINTEKKAKIEPDERQLIGRVSERNSRVQEIQEILMNRSFDVGTPDGFMGPLTRCAIRKFQEAERLNATGRIDQATLTALDKTSKEVLQR